jgi:inner membrane protein
MDPLTHGLVGAAAGQSFSEQSRLRGHAAFCGAISGMMADLDIFIHSPGDPLFNIEVHRQFTHSLIFIPFGALIAAGLLWLILKKQLTFSRFISSVLPDTPHRAYSTHLPAMALSFYGPFWRLDLPGMSSPWLTLSLHWASFFWWVQLSGIVKRSGSGSPGAGLLIFLLFGALQNSRAASAAEQLAEVRGHQPEEFVVKPTIGNQILWRANYIYDGRIYTDAIRTGIFSRTEIYEGTSSPRILVERDFSEFEHTTLYNDLIRFKKLSENYLVRHPDKPDIIGDGRYSMLPTEMVPLWGVQVDTTRTDHHLPFLYFRDAGSEVRQKFTDMLLGR